MGNIDFLELYLRKMVGFCGAYDAFSIPAAMMAGGVGITLQEVYTHLPLIEKSVYESGNGFISDNTPSRSMVKKSVYDENSGISEKKDNTPDSYIDVMGRLISRIDKMIADLDVENRFHSKGKSDDVIRHIVREGSNSEREACENVLGNESYEVEELNWSWILSSPGGGKTTLLKMYSLTYAYKYYVELYDINEKLFGDGKTIESICKQLGVSDGACPIFISARDVNEEEYPNISEADGFKKVVFDSIRSIVGDEEKFDVDELFNKIQKPIYIIDSVEEFVDNDFRTAFLQGLDVFSCGRKCYLSSRLNEYNESLDVTKLERSGIQLYSREEYVIGELIPQPRLISYYKGRTDKVREFAERWYSALNKISERKKFDVDKDFLVPLYKNSNVRNLISNPLELTSMLMISSYDSCLPSDFAKIYGRSIELWLNWTHTKVFNYEDIMRQLSQIAYQMAISENEKIVVSHNTLARFIQNARTELSRYYQLEWPTDDNSIEEFIGYLTGTHLISQSFEGYDFIHRQYQAYLVAYCITTNNFSRETRRKSRFDYIDEHIRDKDDFWNQIIIIISMLDIVLRDDIIEALFSSAECSESDLVDDTYYYLALLIQLAIIPGVNFDSYELEKLFRLIIQNENGWRLFDSRKTDLQELFSLTKQKENDAFINLAIDKYNELDDSKKDAYIGKIASIIFYCLWNCEVGEKCVDSALNIFLQEYFDTYILEIIYNSRQFTKSQSVIKERIKALGKMSLDAGENSKFYSIIAAMAGYENSDNPYKRVDELISKKEFESDVIAINILSIATWLIRCGYAPRFGYNVDISSFAKYSDFILKGILDEDYKSVRECYLAAFSDIFSIGEALAHREIWFKEAVFDQVLRSAISDFQAGFYIYYDGAGEFISNFEHISLYPCDYADLCRNLLEDIEFDTHELLIEIQEIFDSTDNLIVKVRAAKLLVLIGEKSYNERLQIIDEIEGKTKDKSARQKLAYDDHEETFKQSLTQLKYYMPEGKQLIDHLDLSEFTVCLHPDNLGEMDDAGILNELLQRSGKDGQDEYVDYYAIGEYEKAKHQFMGNLQSLSNRNNLAYMLRRNEIKSVELKGTTYSVEDLLKEGIEAKEPFSLMNYALYISQVNGTYIYDDGLQFLRHYQDSSKLLETFIWWNQLKQSGELEGYLVLMWLCDLNLGIFDTKEELEKMANILYPDAIEY